MTTRRAAAARGLRPPAPDVARDRDATYAEAARVLGEWLRPDGLRVSPLGPAWSSDVDAHVQQRPDPAVLRQAGWLPLDDLLARLGRRVSGQWAVVVDGRVVGRVDLHETERPDPVAHLLSRCRERGPGPRDEAEADALRAQGRRVPARLPKRSPARRLRALVGRAVRPARRTLSPRLVVALSGVDGSGKSTLSGNLLTALSRVGVPHTRVWIRPGMISPLVDRVVRLAKRASGSTATPGLHAAARGRAAELRSRQGVLGRLWLGVVVTEFVAGVRRRLLVAEGVVVFDRHRRDAEITLRLFYDVDPGNLAVRLARTALPAADLDVHLRISPELSVARKQEEVVGEWAVASQVEMYDELVPDADDPRPSDEEHGATVVLDAARSPEALALEVLTRLVDTAGAAPGAGSRPGTGPATDHDVAS